MAFPSRGMGRIKRETNPEDMLEAEEYGADEDFLPDPDDSLDGENLAGKLRGQLAVPEAWDFNRHAGRMYTPGVPPVLYDNWAQSEPMEPEPKDISSAKGQAMDPRLQVMNEMMAQQGDRDMSFMRPPPRAVRPGMKSEEDLRAFHERNGLPPPPDEPPPQQFNNDKELLDYIGENIGEGENRDNARMRSSQDLYDDDVDMRKFNRKNATDFKRSPMRDDMTERGPSEVDDLPPTVKQFKKLYGRDPATDAEMEFYYGTPTDDDQDDRR